MNLVPFCVTVAARGPLWHHLVYNLVPLGCHFVYHLLLFWQIATFCLVSMGNLTLQCHHGSLATVFLGRSWRPPLAAFAAPPMMLLLPKTHRCEFIVANWSHQKAFSDSFCFRSRCYLLLPFELHAGNVLLELCVCFSIVLCCVRPNATSEPLST